MVLPLSGMKTPISNWGQYPILDAEFVTPSSPEELRANSFVQKPLIARGMGRCYGDSALSAHIVSTQHWNKYIAFDEQTGELVCEAGLSFDDIIRTFLPRGFFLPVTPGTKFISVGGAIASDIHGKNHHSEGTFSNHLNWFDLLLANRETKRCSKTENADLFWATCGGMGLTGIITRVSFTLKKVETAYIRQTSIRARNLDQLLDLFEETAHYTYSVAWIDCLSRGKSLGRSVLLLGEHAVLDELNTKQKQHPLLVHKDPKLFVPFNFPGFVLNTLSVKAFNFLYYHKAPSGTKVSTVHYEPYYYPLDSVLHWNRIYGKRGFTQYQFVIPKEGGREGMKKIIHRIAESGQGSFLAVLKVFGKEEARHLLFPSEGYTLALDFPVTEKVFKLLDELDKLVLELGGKLYLTKDVRMKRETFAQMYPSQAFEAIRNETGSAGVFESEQSLRLF